MKINFEDLKQRHSANAKVGDYIFCASGSLYLILEVTSGKIGFRTSSGTHCYVSDSSSGLEERVLPKGCKIVASDGRRYIFDSTDQNNIIVRNAFNDTLRWSKDYFLNECKIVIEEEIKHPLPPGTIVRVKGADHIIDYLTADGHVQIAGLKFNYVSTRNFTFCPKEVERIVDRGPNSHYRYLSRDAQVNHPLLPGTKVWGCRKYCGDQYTGVVEIVSTDQDALMRTQSNGHGIWTYKITQGGMPFDAAAANIFFLVEEPMTIKHPLPLGTLVELISGRGHKITQLVGNYADWSDRTFNCYRDASGNPFSQASVQKVINNSFEYAFITLDEHKHKKVKVGSQVWVQSPNGPRRCVVDSISPYLSGINNQGIHTDGYAMYGVRCISTNEIFNVQAKDVPYYIISAEDQKNMSDNDKVNQDNHLDLWKRDTKRGMYKAGARQLVAKGKMAAALALRVKRPDVYEAVEKYIDNKYVDGVIAGGLALFMMNMPGLKDKKHAKLLAEELRSDTSANVIEEVFEFVTNSIFPIVAGALGAFDAMEKRLDSMDEAPALTKSRIESAEAVNIQRNSEAEMTAELEAQIASTPASKNTMKVA